jgi:hypothetical protein
MPSAGVSLFATRLAPRWRYRPSTVLRGCLVDWQGPRLLLNPRRSIRKTAQRHFANARLQNYYGEGPRGLHRQVCSLGRFPSSKFSFYPRWRHIFGKVYGLSLEYDGCGVGSTLFSDFVVSLDCPPELLDFVI